MGRCLSCLPARSLFPFLAGWTELSVLPREERKCSPWKHSKCSMMRVPQDAQCHICSYFVHRELALWYIPGNTISNHRRGKEHSSLDDGRKEGLASAYRKSSSPFLGWMDDLGKREEGKNGLARLDKLFRAVLWLSHISPPPHPCFLLPLYFFLLGVTCRK